MCGKQFELRPAVFGSTRVLLEAVEGADKGDRLVKARTTTHFI